MFLIQHIGHSRLDELLAECGLGHSPLQCIKENAGNIAERHQKGIANSNQISVGSRIVVRALIDDGRSSNELSGSLSI